MTQEAFVPLNRHVLLEDVEPTEKEISPVLIPEDYKMVKEFGIYRVIESALNCENYFPQGQLVVVEENMLRQIDLGTNKKYYIIPENLIVLRSGTVKPKRRTPQGAPFNED